jgi:serine/threonine protein kinase
VKLVEYQQHSHNHRTRGTRGVAAAYEAELARAQEPEGFAREVRVQTYLTAFGLAPRVLDAYIDDKGTGTIVMDEMATTAENVLLRASLEDDESIMERAVGRIALLIHRMHAAGVYHRDLHMGNIMVDSSGNYKVIDLERAWRFDPQQTARLLPLEAVLALLFPDWDPLLATIKTYVPTSPQLDRLNAIVVARACAPIV